jgi:hypothetical protein
VTDVRRQQSILRRNLAANRGQQCDGISLRCCSYTWGEALPPRLSRRWDLVVGSDIVYSKNQTEPLADTLSTLLELGICGGHKPSERNADERYGTRVRSSGPSSCLWSAFEWALVGHMCDWLPTHAAQVLLALPDRTDFGYHRRDADGVVGPTLPDYELLLSDLEKKLKGRLHVVLLDSIESEAYEDCGTSVHVLLLSCDARAKTLAASGR